VGLIGLCVLGAGVVIAVRVTRGHPKAPLQGSVVEWNLSGFSQNRGSVAPAQRLVQEVTTRSPLPLAIVTTETCSTQFDYLRQRLSAAPYGFQAAANWSIPRFNQPNCTSFGNTVFWRGSTVAGGVEDFTYPPATQAQGAATQEKRNMLCVSFRTAETKTTAATTLRVCGTHLHRDPQVSAKQFAVARAKIDADNATGPPTLLVGDLNTVPTAPALNAWYAGQRYVEADSSPRTADRPTTTARVKLDYCFAPAASVTVPVTADIVPVPDLSDHAIYTAHLAFRSAGG
jgi:endonuclease/exonuclease/phosphatase family metal-dependent hydrolase